MLVIEFSKALTSTGRQHALGYLGHLVVGRERVVRHSHQRVAGWEDSWRLYRTDRTLKSQPLPLFRSGASSIVDQ